MSVHIPYTNQYRIINFPQRQRVAINGFCRVNKHRRCRVCEKPDWCGFTTDEQTSICMRISIGSKGTSRNGGNVFHHDRLFLVANPRTNKNQAPPPIEIAPIEVRNAVYQELMRRSPALKYYSQLIDGPNGLLSRGLSESATENYGGLPRTQKERASLAHTLNKFLKVRFPKYAVRSTHAAIIGIPDSGKTKLATFNYSTLVTTTYPCLLSPTETTGAEFKAVNCDFTETIFAPAKRNTDG